MNSDEPSKMTGSRCLPDFESPPVVETALGVEFPAIKGWNILHAGLYWSEIKDEYPTSQVQPPLGSTIERFDDSAQRQSPPPSIEFSPFSDRCWFIDQSGLRLLQLQDTRLLVNWRKNGESTSYPRYPSCLEHFRKEWQRYRGYLTLQQMPEPQALQCEVTYVNHFVQGSEWSTLADMGHMFVHWADGPRDGFLPASDSIVANLRYTMPNQAGRLHVAIAHATRFSDRKQVIQMTLTARGAPASSSEEDICAWFDLGREWVVRGFTELTTPEMHAQWKRKT